MVTGLVLSACATTDQSGLVAVPFVPPVQPPVEAVPPASASAGAGAATPATATVETPAALAAELGAVETAIRSPSTAEAVIDDLGRRQQELYRTLGNRPGWRTEVVDLVPAEVRPAVAANVAADAELAELSEPRAELPRWRIVAPAPVETLVAHYKEAAEAVGVGWEYLAAINLVETRMGRIRGDSSAGARGPMQFMPGTWEMYGEGDINADRDAIFAAARLLKSRGAPADMDRALYAYNNSDHYVAAITAYAEVIRADERAYAAYHAWQVYYGDTLLPEGFTNP